MLFPLTLASNVFVRPATMPGWLQAFVKVNPVSHLVDAERRLLAGHPPAGQITLVLLASAALIAVFVPLTPGSKAGTSHLQAHVCDRIRHEESRPR